MFSLKKIWDFILAVAVAASGSYFLPEDAVKDITTELMAFFSIQSAVILPAMIFTAGILKPDGLEIGDAERYHKALRAQMLFWVVLLSLDFIAVVSLILGKALGWSLSINIPMTSYVMDFGFVIDFIFYFVGSLAILRTIPFVKGVVSLLDLNSEMTEKAIRRRNRLENFELNSKSDQRPMTLPEGYGKIMESDGDE